MGNNSDKMTHIPEKPTQSNPNLDALAYLDPAVASNKTDDHSNNQATNIIYETAKSYALESMKVATMGILLTAGGGGNLPACTLLLCIAGIGGTIVGGISGTISALSSNDQPIPSSTPVQKRPQQNYAQNNFTHTMFPGEPNRDDQNHPIHRSASVPLKLNKNH